MRRRAVLLSVCSFLAACAPQPPTVVPAEAGGPGRPYRLMQLSGLAIADVTVDSASSGNPAGLSVDANLGSQWINGGYRNPTSWAVARLTAPADLESLSLKTGPSPTGTRFDVHVSSDNGTWTTVLAGQRNTTWNMEKKAFPSRVRAQYVRVFWYNNPTSPVAHFGIFELTVEGAGGSSTPSPAPTATPTPSPTATPGTPSSTVQAMTRLSPAWKALASVGNALAAVDGAPGTYWGGGAGSWISVPLNRSARGPLVVAWDSTPYSAFNNGAAPRAYAVQYSTDSSDGRGGTWITARSYTENALRSRHDPIQAPGARWIRLNVSSRWITGPELRELVVYEPAGPGRLDDWLFMGDSITASAFDPSQSNRFPDEVAARVSGYRPAWLGGGTGGDTAQLGQQKLAKALPLMPPGAFVGLAFGTNDATRGVPVSTFKATLQQMVTSILASGRTPVIARTPWNLNPAVPEYVAAIDAVTAANGLTPGPDMYGWFKAHPEELLTDRVHPNAAGQRSIQRLWAEAAARAYRR